MQAVATPVQSTFRSINEKAEAGEEINPANSASE
jgi:hypothetical protein